MKGLIFFAFLLSIVLCEQLVPIQQQYDGLVFGSNTSRLHIEGFYDLGCPLCQRQDKVLYQLFGLFQNYPFKFTVHHYPLSYRAHSFLLHQGAQYIYETFGADIAQEYYQVILLNQDKFSNDNTDLLSSKDVRNLLFNVVKQYFGDRINLGQFLNALSDRSINLQVRASWKYGCSRGFGGTPGYLANGVVIDGAGSWTADDWKTFLKNYL